MIRRISTYLMALVLLALTACRDDFSSPTGGGIDDDGNLHVAFSISPLKVVTRASDGISNIYMYAYDTDGSELLRQVSKVEITEVGSTTKPWKGKVPLNSNVISNLSKTQFVFIANLDEQEANTLQTLKGKKTSFPDNGSYYIMSSEPETFTSVEGNTVSLIHNAVKVTVNQAKQDSNGNFLTTVTDGVTTYQLGDAYNFNVAGSAEDASVLAGGCEILGKSVEQNFNGFSVDTEDKYIHPTDNASTGQANTVYVIVKAKYKDNREYYYRLDFQTAEKINSSGSDALNSGNVTTKPFNVLPNHWYQFVVKNVNGTGYVTPEEAAKNPTPMIDYEIHDHSPKIFNMISDGSRELGVSKSVTNHNSAIGSTMTLDVKLFSLTEGEDNELPTFTDGTTNTAWKDFIKIDEDVDWLTVKSISKNTNSADIGSSAPDRNDAGQLYTVVFEFTETKNPGKLETVVSVTWRGLTRDVPVVWNRSFDTADLFNYVNIKAYEGQPSEWNSAKGTAGWGSYRYFTYTEDDTEKGFFKEYAYGTTAQQNNGEDREDGFHFPMPYYNNDTKSKLMKYMYEVELNNNLVTGTNTWSVASTGVNNVQFSLNGSSDWDTSLTDQPSSQKKFYIRCTDDSYDYQIGNLVLKVSDGVNLPTTYDNVKIYHTGFFYQDRGTSTNSGTGANQSFISGGVNTGLGYYEVFTCGSDHWLDRNIGASAANSYIEGGMGTDDSAGYAIVAAHYLMHNDPVIYNGMCPPGYTVPSVDQWDNLRQASNFTINLVSSFYIPTFIAEKGKIVYFPKIRYIEDSKYQGEPRAGYYWSSTAANGTEKQEIGNWLKCLTMAGTATSYINGKVQGKSGEKPYYMSLRAVTPDDNDAPVNRVSFFVTGATHVYLYTEDGNKSRNAITQWPGQAVGNYLTMQNDQRFNFTYESKVNKIEDLKVIFNRVDANNRIITYSKDNFTGDLTHTNINPDKAQGWDVKGSIQSTDFSYTDCQVKINTATSGNGTVWACGGQGFGAAEATLYRILWPQTEEGYTKISMVGTNVTNAQATSTDYGYDDKKWCSYDFKTTAESVSFTLTFTNASGETVTPQGNPTYTLADMTESINGASGLIIASLPGTTPPIPKINIKFAWDKTLPTYFRLYDETDKKWILGSETTFIQKNGDGNWNRSDNGNNISAWSYYGPVASASNGHQVRLYISDTAAGSNIKQSKSTRQLSTNDPFWVLGTDNFQAYSGGGGEDPIGDTYRIWWKSSTFTSQDYIYIKNSDNSYTKHYQSGEENGYRYYDHDSGDVTFYFATSSGDNKYQASGNNDWSFTASNTNHWSKDGDQYHHWIDDWQTGGAGKPSGSGGVSIPANTYRVYWKKNLGAHIKYNSGTITAGHSRTGESGDYYYFDTTHSTFNFCLCDENGNNEYKADGNNWWVMNSSSWGQVGSGYAFWVNQYNSSGKGLPDGI